MGIETEYATDALTERQKDGPYASLEKERLALQRDLDSAKPVAERRKLGQYSTPPALARDIVAYGLSQLEAGTKIRFLDPAIGTGAFYSALISLLEESGIGTGLELQKATGVEIDPALAEVARHLWQRVGLEVVNADFTCLDPDCKHGSFNLAICNPPYVRHQLMDMSEKLRIGEKTRQLTGVKLSGLAGLYCHFMLQSVYWMAPGAVCGWLVPGEFMDVNYGKALKDFLVNQVDLFRIHRFGADDMQFSDALVSSGVVWFRTRVNSKGNSKANLNGKQPGIGNSVPSTLFTLGASLADPDESGLVGLEELRQEAKWTHFPHQAKSSGRSPGGKAIVNGSKLKDYFDVKRGIATGGNGFFIMDEARIEALGLPMEFFRPVLPSARHLKTTEILADKHGNPILDRRLFLLDCRLSEEEIQALSPALHAYLESGKDSVAGGYLCRTRKCWYFQEQREAAAIVCNYMGRQGESGAGAFRFILNHSKATVTNSYLALYPKPKGSFSEIFGQNPQLRRTIWERLNGLDPDTLHSQGRVYGGGLQKIEPRELMNVDASFMQGLLDNAR